MEINKLSETIKDNQENFWVPKNRKMRQVAQSIDYIYTEHLEIILENISEQMAPEEIEK